MVNRIFSIFKKDYLEIKKNNYLFLTACMPILFSILIYFNVGEDASDIELFLTLCGTYVFSIILVLASTIAEEKEYKTLEALIMSPASFIEILVGKSIVPILIGVFNYFMGCYFLLDLDLHSDITELVLLILMIVFSVLLGILIGLVSKNITQVNLLFIPVFVFVTLPVLYDQLLKYNEWLYAIRYLPSAQQYALFINDTNLFLSISLIVLWSVLVTVLNYYFYRRVIINK